MSDCSIYAEHAWISLLCATKYKAALALVQANCPITGGSCHNCRVLKKSFRVWHQAFFD